MKNMNANDSELRKEYIVKVYKDHTIWYLNSKLHREDGPAIEYVDGDKYWYLNGQQLTKAEFNSRMNKTLESYVYVVVHPYTGKMFGIYKDPMNASTQADLMSNEMAMGGYPDSSVEVKKIKVL